MNIDGPTSYNIHMSFFCLMAEHFPVKGKTTSLHEKNTAAWLQALVPLMIFHDCLIQGAMRQGSLDVRSQSALCQYET